MRSLFSLYPISPRQRILEDVDFGGEKGEKRKTEGNCYKEDDSCFWEFTRNAFFLKEFCFIEIGDGGGDEKDGNVDPIGGFSDDAVVGIKDHGNQKNAKQDPAQLDAPKIFAVTEEKALHNGKHKHRPEQQLHMLPRGFIYSRKGSDPQSSPKPIV